MTKRSKESLMKRQHQGKLVNKKLLAQSQGDLNLKCNLLAEQFKQLSEAIGVIFNNQKELSASETKLDEQFAVLTRLSIMAFNIMFKVWNRYRQESMKGLPEGVDNSLGTIPLISYDDINKLFGEWATFKARPDWRDHTREWFMGEDLTQLPPVELKKEIQDGESKDSPGDTSDSGQSSPDPVV